MRHVIPVTEIVPVRLLFWKAAHNSTEKRLTACLRPGILDDEPLHRTGSNLEPGASIGSPLHEWRGWGTADGPEHLGSSSGSGHSAFERNRPRVRLYANAPTGFLPGRLGSCARTGLKYVVVFQQERLGPADPLAQLAIRQGIRRTLDQHINVVVIKRFQ